MSTSTRAAVQYFAFGSNSLESSDILRLTGWTGQTGCWARAELRDDIGRVADQEGPFLKVEKNLAESEIRPCDLVCLGDTDNVEEAA